MRRRNSSLERYMLFFGRQYPLNFGFRVAVTGRPGQDRLRTALRGLAKRHPLVFARQEYAEGKQTDMIVDAEPSILLRERTETSPWQELLLSCMIREFDPFRGPLFSLDWRRTGETTELFFVFQHGVADGIAATWIIHDFLKLCADLPVTLPDVPVMPVLYEVLDEAVYRELLTRPEPAWKKEPPPEPKPFAMPAYKAPDFYLETFSMTSEATARLAAEAKAAGETVHSWLGALLMKESAEVFGGDGGLNRTIQCPVDFRQYLKEEYRPIAGVYNGIVKVKLDCAGSVPEMAKTIREGIRANRDGMKDIEEYFHFRDSFDAVPDPESLMMSFPPDTVDYDFSFSNLGRTVIAPRYGDFAVSEFYGPIFTAVHGETVIGLNTTNGALRMSLIFDRDIPQAERYRELGKRIKKTLAGFEPA